MDAVAFNVSQLVEDLGRLRRMKIQNHVLDRLCDRAETMALMVSPTAAELHLIHGMPVLEALAHKDAEEDELRRILRPEPK